VSEIAFDYALDLSDSTAFSEGYVDREGGLLYLVFRESGSVVSHVIPDWLDDATIAVVPSWGQLWNQHLKYGSERGPNVDPDEDEFVLRTEVPAEDTPEPEVETTVQAEAVDVDRVMQVFIQRLTDNGWMVDNEADRDFRAALTEALATIPTVEVEQARAVLPEPVTGELVPGVDPAEHYAREARMRGPEQQDNLSGSVIGVTFVEVPDEDQHTVHSLTVSFVQFIKESVNPDLKSFVSATDADTLRGAVKGMLS